MRRILITGATGNVGRGVLELLAREPSRHAIRAGVRKPESLAAFPAQGVEVVPLDLERPETFSVALRGVQALFLMLPPGIPGGAATVNRFLDAAKDHGIEHVVFLSVVGADRLRFIPHHQIESHITAIGMSATFLRASYFAQNFGGAFRETIRRENRIFVPARDLRIAFVDTRDLAEVAAGFLTERFGRRAAVTLTGTQLLGFADAAQIFSEVLGRTIVYEPASLIGFAWHQHREGCPWSEAIITTLINSPVGFAPATKTDGTLAELLGPAVRSLRNYIVDHAQLWQR